MQITVWQAPGVAMAMIDGAEPLPTPWVRLTDALEGLRELHPYATISEA